MNLHISAVNAMIVVFACVAAYVVYGLSKRQSSAVSAGQARGDLTVALTAAATVLLMLAFLFGAGDGSSTPAEDSPRPPARTALPG
ncbi:hypothetical protein M2167_007800 [Streptomyces sp. SPB4]|nr:hypothetical protein [Streptomyces sp. SPB4]